jgi:hypothetical protein
LGIRPPTRQAFHNLNTRFEETSSAADLPRSGRPRSARSEENVQNIAHAFVHSPNKSIRRASRELEISRSSLHLMLHTLRFKPYRPHLLHVLNDDDPERRTEFCEWFMIMHETDPKKKSMDR